MSFGIFGWDPTFGDFNPVTAKILNELCTPASLRDISRIYVYGHQLVVELINKR